jgi:tRNA/rRNA methyltransferase
MSSDALMPRLRIVLVGSKFEGNVGAVARSMANFGLDDLRLVDPVCAIGDEARSRAKHGGCILDRAVTTDTLEEAVADCFLVAGTSGILALGDGNYTRVPVPAGEFAQHCRGYEGDVALVFGREDIGLYQDELNRCDVLITVPTADEHPILNLSHAATLVMYEFFKEGSSTRRPVPADRDEKERMFDFFNDLLAAIDYPENRRGNTAVMFRRMMGRSVPTKYEYNTILGVFGDAAKIIRNGKRWG